MNTVNRLIPNAHITIYNRYIDSVTRSEKYQRSEIKNVVWQATKAISNTRFQLIANVATIFIPFALGADYLKPKEWITAQVGKWTLQEGDIIVRGIVNDEITSSFTAKNLQETYDDVVTITSVDAMDQGSPNMRHWQIGAK